MLRRPGYLICHHGHHWFHLPLGLGIAIASRFSHVHSGLRGEGAMPSFRTSFRTIFRAYRELTYFPQPLAPPLVKSHWDTFQHWPSYNLVFINNSCHSAALWEQRSAAFANLLTTSCHYPLETHQKPHLLYDPLCGTKTDTFSMSWPLCGTKTDTFSMGHFVGPKLTPFLCATLWDQN